MDKTQIPTHVGYIVDGNRRWARTHGLPVYEGHMAGYAAIQEVVQATFEAGVKCVSIYVFSTENWKRSQEEVSKLMELALRMFKADLHLLLDNGIKVKVLGSREGVSDKVMQAMDEAEHRTADNTRATLAACFNYGGQVELADAFRRIVEAGVAPDDITPDLITENLYASEIPPIDIIVRTGGEQRLSNFMLWRAAYSEFMFIDKPWPEMTKEDVAAILKEYTERNRRFGG